ncbi:hypothetical protein TNIN_138621 [Trichonephila inaurata madagascariensis]|uniref:Uncharacterized protein n=1 Tax=Trichonephila inaurata madagascariensis TaxID=2747483 RepID=A0A8X6X128_9ARAC|nr:hypothetical protein TNIN_321751 [Trichonephila inaurata madagascariensis]GFY74206.1 hypothetical protein TNIN_138621 [Trichonephila inaurata madagascariensis]
MPKEILMGAFVLLHCLFCLLKIFCHFDILYCIHLIPYFIFIDYLKNNLRSTIKLAKQDPTVSNIEPKKTVSNDDSKIIHDPIIRTSDGFFNETPHKGDETMLEMNNVDLRFRDLELIQNEIPFLDDSSKTNSVAIHLNDAAVQWTPAERNGSLTFTTFSSSFTNVTEIELFNDSDDPKDFDDFSLILDRDMESTSSDLTSLSNSEDVQFTEVSSVPKKRNAYQKVKKFFGRLMKATPSCCRRQRLH